MTNAELKIFIDKLNAQGLDADATFAIMQYGGDSDESCIVANRAGLILFAGNLLEAASQAEELLAAGNSKEYTLDYDAAWIDRDRDNDVRIRHIELVRHRKLIETPVESEEDVLDKMTRWGCISLFILFAIAIPIGLWTLARWIF